MKIVTRNTVVMYMFSDDQSLTLGEDKLSYSLPPYEVEDPHVNSSIGQVVENVTIPDDAAIGKSTYIDGVWGINPDWIPPNPEPNCLGKWYMEEGTWVEDPDWADNPRYVEEPA